MHRLNNLLNIPVQSHAVLTTHSQPVSSSHTESKIVRQNWKSLKISHTQLGVQQREMHVTDTVAHSRAQSYTIAQSQIGAHRCK